MKIGDKVIFVYEPNREDESSEPDWINPREAYEELGLIPGQEYVINDEVQYFNDKHAVSIIGYNYWFNKKCFKRIN